MEKDIKIPKKITPDPISESVVELRFKTNLPADAVFGMLYKKLNEMFPDSYESLSILQLHEADKAIDNYFAKKHSQKSKKIIYKRKA